jgi:D-galactarolactone cycloisomerase
VKVVEIRGHLVRCRLPEAQGNATGFYDQRSSLLVELVDESGTSGWGEAWHSPEAAAAIIRSSLGRVVLGQPAAEYGRLWDEMFARLGYDQRGGGLMALSALDMALWDLRARQLGIPLATLLGGARRSHAFAYAAGPYFRPGGDPYRSYVEQTKGYVRDGFRAIKMKIGIDPVSDAKTVAAVRQAVGPGIALMVDANQGYTADGAAEVARRLEPFEVVWFEEPVGPFDRGGYRRVAAALRVPIAGGEALGGVGAFLDFIREGSPAVVEPDLAICGGFTEAVRIAAIADAHGRPLVPHVWGTAINFYATLQWVAALPDRRGLGPTPFPWFEFDRSPNSLRDLFGIPVPGSDGRIAIPTDPGLGITVDPSKLSSYTVEQWRLGFAKD